MSCDISKAHARVIFSDRGVVADHVFPVGQILGFSIHREEIPDGEVDGWQRYRHGDATLTLHFKTGERGPISPERAGRVGYDAYAASTGGKTYDGRDMPTWDELPQRIRDAWDAAAAAVLVVASK